MLLRIKRRLLPPLRNLPPQNLFPLVQLPIEDILSLMFRPLRRRPSQRTLLTIHLIEDTATHKDQLILAPLSMIPSEIAKHPLHLLETIKNPRRITIHWTSGPDAESAHDPASESDYGTARCRGRDLITGTVPSLDHTNAMGIEHAHGQGMDIAPEDGVEVSRQESRDAIHRHPD